jgi:hypothetical protein
MEPMAWLLFGGNPDHFPLLSSRLNPISLTKLFFGMPTLQQPIRDYALLFSHNRTANQPPVHARTRFIHIHFGNDPARLNLLILGFVPDATSATTGEVTKLTNGTYRVSARVLVADYAAYVDLLRYEKPVLIRVDYDPEPAVGQSAPVRDFTLFTGPEPLGEGPKDASV